MYHPWNTQQGKSVYHVANQYLLYLKHAIWHFIPCPKSIYYSWNIQINIQFSIYFLGKVQVCRTLLAKMWKIIVCHGKSVCIILERLNVTTFVPFGKSVFSILQIYNFVAPLQYITVSHDLIVPQRGLKFIF